MLILNETNASRKVKTEEKAQKTETQKSAAEA